MLESQLRERTVLWHATAWRGEADAVSVLEQRLSLLFILLASTGYELDREMPLDNSGLSCTVPAVPELSEKSDLEEASRGKQKESHYKDLKL